MPQNHLQTTNSSDSVLDLRGLVEPDLCIIDSSGQTWPVPAALPLRTVLELLSLEQAAQDMAGAVSAQIDGLCAILRLRTPEATREQVVDAFSLPELRQLIEWLSFRLAGQAMGADGAQPTPASPRQPTQHPRRGQERRARTPKPSSSAPASPRGS